jgi:tRNA modification GTPase
MLFDTIVGIATLRGVSALNVVRVSGSDAIHIVGKLFAGKDLDLQSTHSVSYGHIVDEDTVLDEVLVSIFREPKSFTAENVVEISTHGGFLIADKIVESLIKNGCRLAEPGEFTKRAYLNGRIDLTQAESIMDMVNAKTTTQLQIANQGLNGQVKSLIEELQTELLSLVAKIEVNIDYPEYDDAITMTNEIILPETSSLIEKIDAVLIKSNTGKIIREGVKTVIIGKPNVGKSSLLNTLLREEKAIVTEISGTTRDLIEGELNLGGILLKLIDTAGIRTTSDIVEKIGIDRAKKALSEADLVLLVLDQSQSITDADKDLLALTKDKTRIIVGNKTDLGSSIHLDDELMIRISAKNKTGIEELESEVKRLFVDEKLIVGNEIMLSNTRHIGKLKEAREALKDAVLAAKKAFPVDMVEIDLKRAWECLGEITGEFGTDALITTLFSKFCLGK